MSILTINCNARLTELLSGLSSGQLRPHIYNPAPHKKLEYQIFVSKELEDNGFTPFIEVKFVSQYSSREKRIEVVGIRAKEVLLYQFSSRAFFDKDANELARLIEEIRSLKISKGYTVTGAIILQHGNADVEKLNEALSNLGLDIAIKTI